MMIEIPLFKPRLMGDRYYPFRVVKRDDRWAEERIDFPCRMALPCKVLCDTLNSAMVKVARENGVAF